MRNPSLMVGAVLLAASASTNAAGQTVSWPAARSTHGMVWHEGAGEALLLGGVAADSAMWAWDGRGWRQRAFGGPTGRAHFGIAYDAHRDRVVVHGGVAAVFGGQDPTAYGDTWEWDGQNWRSVASEGPGLRDHHAMVYDPVRRQTILFGGNSPADSIATMSDTWAWDGRTWRKLADVGPPGRATHRMVFDSRRGRVVLFGGWGEEGLLNDTWAWNGQTWTRLAESGPAPRFAARMAYDRERDRIVLFGGRGSTGPGAAADFGDTWEFDGTAWTQVMSAGPAIRNVHEMVYDARRRQVLVFGGFHAPRRFDDLWAFDGRGWQQLARVDTDPPPGGFAPRGPYGVGFRVINHRDHTRALAPARDFEGRPATGRRSVPMQVSVWYPAAPGTGSPETEAYYRALDEVRLTLSEPTTDDVAGAGAAIQTEARMHLGLDLPRAVADSIARATGWARRDARPAEGRFPLIVGIPVAPAAAAGLAEHLASHGYVVMTTPDLPRTVTLEATEPQIAMEFQTRSLEVLTGLAWDLPFVDADRLGLLGWNFGGLAALLHQMRNMSASAVASLDGWEALRPEILPASPSYAPERVRVPYLLVTSDDANLPALTEDAPILEELRYSERYAYELRDMMHPQILGNHTIYPQITAERRLGYDFLQRTLLGFFDAHLKGDSTAAASLRRPTTGRGYPGWLAKTEVARPALAPIPAAEEVEAIAMSGDIARLAAIHRRAVEENPAAELFSRSTLNLFAVRFGQRGHRETALALYRLAVEAFPGSALAHNDLGNAYRDTGQDDLALEHWRLALERIDGDPDITTEEARAQSRRVIEEKIGARLNERLPPEISSSLETYLQA